MGGPVVCDERVERANGCGVDRPVEVPSDLRVLVDRRYQRLVCGSPAPQTQPRNDELIHRTRRGSRTTRGRTASASCAPALSPRARRSSGGVTRMRSGVVTRNGVPFWLAGATGQVLGPRRPSRAGAGVVTADAGIDATWGRGALR